MQFDYAQFTREELGRAYEHEIGYNPFEDDPKNTVEEVAQILKEYDDEMIREEGRKERPVEKFLIKHRKESFVNNLIIQIEKIRPNIIGCITKGNARNKELGFSYYELAKKYEQVDEQEGGAARNNKLILSFFVNVDCIERKVTSWDYDQDEDQAEANKRGIHSRLSKILN